MLGKLESVELSRRKIIAERRETGGGAHGIGRFRRHPTECFVAANHAVIAAVEQCLPDIESVDVGRDPVHAAFADGEEPLQDRLGRMAPFDGKKAVRCAERARNFACDLHVAATFVLALRQSPRDGVDAAIAQQTQQAAAVGSAG